MASRNNTVDMSERIIQRNWVIKNWKEVVHNEALLNNTETEIHFEVENVIYASFLIGTFPNNINGVGLYWKLTHKHPCLDNVQVNLVTEILRKEGYALGRFEVQANGEAGNRMEICREFWCRSHEDHEYSDWINCEGSLVIKLTFALKNLPDDVCSYATEEFQKGCINECNQNLAALLHDKLSSDVKIVTKDEVELFAHKAILRARCPVFASMFGSDFLEASTAVVNVDDITSKTMSILLKFWYSGELLPSWKDNDTVVEFVYAAGKYQMKGVLKMLNGVIGCDFIASYVDVELLKMVQQLSLKNAEARLLKRLKHKIIQVSSGFELLAIFDLDADILEKQSFSTLDILTACNDVMGETDDTDASCQDIKLMALACKAGMSNVEDKLLKRVISTVLKLESTDDLFELFEVQIEVNDDSSDSDSE